MLASDCETWPISQAGVVLRIPYHPIEDLESNLFSELTLAPNVPSIVIRYVDFDRRVVLCHSLLGRSHRSSEQCAADMHPLS